MEHNWKADGSREYCTQCGTSPMSAAMRGQTQCPKPLPPPIVTVTMEATGNKLRNHAKMCEYRSIIKQMRPDVSLRDVQEAAEILYDFLEK